MLISRIRKYRASAALHNTIFNSSTTTSVSFQTFNLMEVWQHHIHSGSLIAVLPRSLQSRSVSTLSIQELVGTFTIFDSAQSLSTSFRHRHRVPRFNHRTDITKLSCRCFWPSKPCFCHQKHRICSLCHRENLQRAFHRWSNTSAHGHQGQIDWHRFRLYPRGQDEEQSGRWTGKGICRCNIVGFWPLSIYILWLW